jgi:hypothetical protein
MANLFKAPIGADFSAHAVAFVPPVIDGLAGWFYLGGTLAKTQRDRAGIANGVLAGSPTIEANYVSFGGFATGQWLQTSIAETDDITILCAARSADTFGSGPDRPMFVSNYGVDAGNGGAAIGASVYIDGGTAPAGTVRLGGGQDNNGTIQGQINTVITTTNVSVWNFYAARMAQTDDDNTVQNNARHLFNKTTGQSNTTNNYPRVSHSANLFRVGASYSSSFGGICDVAFVAIYSRALTNDEIEEIYQAVKTRLAAVNSITV